MARREDTQTSRSHRVAGRFHVDGIIVKVYGDRVCELGNPNGHTLRRLGYKDRADFTVAGTTSPGRSYRELFRTAVVEVMDGGLCWANHTWAKYVEVEPNYRNQLVAPLHFLFDDDGSPPLAIPPHAFLLRTNASTFWDLNHPRERACMDWLRCSEQDARMPHDVVMPGILKEAMTSAARIGTIMALGARYLRGDELLAADEEIRATMLRRFKGRRIPSGYEIVILTGLGHRRWNGAYMGGAVVALVKTSDPWLPAALVGVHSQHEFAPEDRMVACGYWSDGAAFCRHSRMPQSDFWSTADRGHAYGGSQLVGAIGEAFVLQHAEPIGTLASAQTA